MPPADPNAARPDIDGGWCFRLLCPSIWGKDEPIWTFWSLDAGSEHLTILSTLLEQDHELTLILHPRGMLPEQLRLTPSRESTGGSGGKTDIPDLREWFWGTSAVEALLRTPARHRLQRPDSSWIPTLDDYSGFRISCDRRDEGRLIAQQTFPVTSEASLELSLRILQETLQHQRSVDARNWTTGISYFDPKPHPVPWNDAMHPSEETIAEPLRAAYRKYRRTLSTRETLEETVGQALSEGKEEVEGEGGRDTAVTSSKEWSSRRHRPAVIACFVRYAPNIARVKGLTLQYLYYLINQQVGHLTSTDVKYGLWYRAREGR